MSWEKSPKSSVAASGRSGKHLCGLPTDAMVEAVKLMAQYEGILLDPVYSGKGFSGLVDLIRKGHFKKGENVVFLHTGGSISLFGYPNVYDLPGYI